jgi:hypothetical protein
LSVLWRLGRAMSYDVATQANTSSNQAIKDPGQWRCGYSNLGKIVKVIKFIQTSLAKLACMSQPHRTQTCSMLRLQRK